MQSFLQRYAGEIKGVLSGFDRIRFRGTIRWLSSLDGMATFLGTTRVMLKDFHDWAAEKTERIRQSTQELAARLGRDVVYVHSSNASKEQLAREIAEREGVSEGLVCVLSCVEPCYSFQVSRNRERKQLELGYGARKCLHYYFYLRDPQMGWLHVRLQTWAPFTVQICVNGRDWLARQLISQDVSFEQRDNCFVGVGDMARAQALLDRQLRTDWTDRLDDLLRQVHPAHATMFGERPLDYYWSADETEWATDVLFCSPAGLARVYPRLTRHALLMFQSADVLRFLGQCPDVYRYGKAEIVSSLKGRPEGVRVKHARNGNSVKMYDKQQTVLRVETTINDPRDLKVLRPKEGEPKGPKKYLQLRKGVADLHRRAEVSQKSNERYLEALSSVDSSASLDETVRPLCQPTRWKGRPVRGLQPLNAQDSALLAAVSRGEFAVNGFRNRDLCQLLFKVAPRKSPEAKRQAAKVTRMLRLLRAHGLIHKVAKTHRYQLTTRGSVTITAVRAAQHATIASLTQLAA